MLKIKITEISDAGNDYFDADGVHYSVIEGDPSEQQVNDFLNDHSISACNIGYCEETKSGYFVNMEFEFKEEQIIEKVDKLVVGEEQSIPA